MCGQFGIPFWKFFLATLFGKAIIKTHIQVCDVPLWFYIKAGAAVDYYQKNRNFSGFSFLNQARLLIFILEVQCEYLISIYLISFLQTVFIISVCNNQLLDWIENELIWVLSLIPGFDSFLPTLTAKLHAVKEKYLAAPRPVPSNSKVLP